MSPLAWIGAALAQADEVPPRGPDAAVVVGIEDYASLPDVPFARRDAALVRDWLLSTRGLDPGRVTVLDGGTREQLCAAVRDAAADGAGTVFVYFAGRGVAAADGAPLLLGDDAPPAPEPPADRGVPLDELVSLAAGSGAQVVALVDAAFAGARGSGQLVAAGTRFAVPVWVAGERPDPVDSSHGAVTWLTIGALRGVADGAVDGVSDGHVTAGEVDRYVARGLERLGLVDPDPVVVRRDPGRWSLAIAAAPQPAPATAGPTAPIGPTPVPPSWPASLEVRSLELGVALPLHRTLFGYEDARGARIRRRTYADLARATPRGRLGQALRVGGAVGLSAGWVVAATAGTLYAFDGGEGYRASTLAGGVSAATGFGVLILGQGVYAGAVPTD